MPSSGFNLSGTIDLNAMPAVKSAQALGQRLNTLSTNSRTTTKVLGGTAGAMIKAARAADIERTSLTKLALAQAKVDDVTRNSRAKAALTRAGVAVPIAKASAITSGAEDKSAIASAQRQLVLNRGLTETIKQRIAVEDAEGRTAVRNAQIASAATRDRIAQERLLLSQQRAAQAAMASSKVSSDAARTAFRDAGSSLAHFGAISGAIFIGVAANAVIMEREFANVIRTSDILDSGFSKLEQNKAIDGMRLQFDALAQTLPISYKELTEIAAAANQLGVSHNNLASFTKTVAQFSAVTGVSVDTASTAFGRLDSLITNSGGRINGVNHDYTGLADAINKVGVNSVATDQQIINISSQIAGVASAAGLGYKEIVGFSGALASVGISPYLARGMTTRLFTNITNAVADGGNELDQFAATAGMSAEAFSAAWRSNPQKAIENLFDGIRGSGGDAVNVLKSLGVSSVLDQPALVRLANAADKFGKSANGAARNGGILRQTFNDANTAAGENARQYSVIADTVQARLQVALNNVQILFRNIGSSNLGPLGDAISSITSDVLKLSQNLDKPFKLLGSIELPFTQGQLAGSAIGLLGIASALTLLAAAGARGVAAFLTLRKAAQWITGQMAGNAASLTASTAATNSQAAANARLAASYRAIPIQKTTTPNTGAFAGVFNKIDTAMARSSFVARSFFNDIATGSDRAITKMMGMSTSSNKVVRALAPLGTVGVGGLSMLQSAGTKTIGLFNRMSGVVARTGSAISSMVGGPMGLAALAGIGGFAWLSSLDRDMGKLGSSAGDVSVQLLNAKNSAELLSKVKVSAATDGVAALFDKSTKSFMTSSSQLGASLKNLGSGGFIEDFGAKFRSMFLSGGELDQGFNYTTKGLDKINDGFKNLADSGNLDGAVKGIQTLFKGQSDQAISNALAHMSDVTSILTTKLNENGKTAGKNNANLIALAKSSGILGGEEGKAAAQAAAMNDAFHGNAAAATEYLAAVKTAADASTDLNKAWGAAAKVKGGSPFGNFIKQAKKDFQDFVNYQKNALKIASDTGISLTELSKLDPGILAGAVKSGKKGEKELADVMQLKDAKDAFVAAVAQISQTPGLLDAFGKLGKGAQQKVVDALRDGASIADAFAQAGKDGVDAFNGAVKGADPKIKISADATPAKTAAAQAAATISARKTNMQIFGDNRAAISSGDDADSIISKMRAFINVHAKSTMAFDESQTTAENIARLQAIIKVQGNPAPARQSGESASAYIGRLQATIAIGADDKLARRAGEALPDYIGRLKGAITIDGDPVPAQHKGESAADYISRIRTQIMISADDRIAKLKGQDAATQINQLQGMIQILGQPAPAKATGESTKAYINRLIAFLKIEANDDGAQAKARAAQKQISTLSSSIKVHGNVVPAQKDGESAQAYINRLKGLIAIQGNDDEARSKARGAKGYADSLKGTIEVNGYNVPAIHKGESARAYINRLTGRLTVDGRNAPAIQKGESAKHYIDRLRGTMTADAHTGTAESELNHAARDRTANITAKFHGGGGSFATGGPVRGPGSGTSDSIRARLSNGEYVIRASQARKHRELLDAINYAGPGFANGGPVNFASGGQVTEGSAKYDGTQAALQSSVIRVRDAAMGTSVNHMTELSPYDRHLLQTIADNIGVTIAPHFIANATTATNRNQGRRGNG